MMNSTQADIVSDAVHAETHCYHCGLPNPGPHSYLVTITGKEHAMCCPGCQAVAQAIVGAGLDDYYRHRTEPANTAGELVPAALQNTKIYDNPVVQRGFVRPLSEQEREASLILEGITCPACLWLNERHLRAQPGVVGVDINYATRRAQVRWDSTRIALSDILQAIAAIGYRAHPYDPARQQRLLEQERASALRRLGLAAILGMQVMILAVAMYAGDWFGMESEFRHAFSWLSLGLTLPVLGYAARPFWLAAWRDLRLGRAGMDVPVTLGLTLAFSASAWATWRGEGQVYFDSVVMFVFFLLSARYFELAARKRALEASETLISKTPTTATRLLQRDGQEVQEIVAASELQAGDRVLLRPGDSAPADGRILQGSSTVDESILTGESLPRRKHIGDHLIGGSINRDSPLTMEVEKTGETSTLAGLVRLVQRAQAHKPAMAQLADRLAAYFVLAVLTLTSLVAYYWWSHDSTQWLAITVAVLVVTCPCALSLATPAAMTAATAALLRQGLLVTRGHALEALARANHFVFDKTGTLTMGQLRLLDCLPLANLDRDDCLAYARALEQHSEHPIAKAISDAGNAETVPILTAHALHNTPGCGMQGRIRGKLYFIGTSDFIHNHSRAQVSQAVRQDLLQSAPAGSTSVWLADEERLLAALVLADTPRPGARSLIKALKQQGKTVMILSGDQAPAVEHLAQTLGIDIYSAALTPEQKLLRVKQLQQQGAIVAMIGDGVNDAPVLQAAHVSIAMASGTQLAASSADMLFLSQSLGPLVQSLASAKQAMAVIRQNLSWAVAYNLTALPLAAAGFIQPWAAALGMSLSSLLVVANALRLQRHPRVTMDIR